MTYLKFDVDQRSWETSTPDPEDRWDRASTDGSVSIIGARISEQDSHDALPIDFNAKAGDTVWLVWAQYSTGDSFGSDGGQYELCAVFDGHEKAGAEEARLEKVTDYSVPWNGYFENLTFLRVQPIVVQP